MLPGNLFFQKLDALCLLNTAPDDVVINHLCCSCCCSAGSPHTFNCACYLLHAIYAGTSLHIQFLALYGSMLSKRTNRIRHKNAGKHSAKPQLPQPAERGEMNTPCVICFHVAFWQVCMHANHYMHVQHSACCCL